ncbi:hypothetical protein CL629_03245 [bacterium]|nr:hypothetical protein [bacterium]|tara:strand:+ start:807 stop:2078 length:1272 start_codon:yes stop_codon:yes gene_type:complete
MKKEFRRVQLENGLRVILVPQKGSVATTVMVFVAAGSKYETKKINGISHFLEHMMFKGTDERLTAMDIASELDGLGAQYNAFTGQEMTAYYAKVRNEYFEQALDVVSDIYLHPRFESSEIEKERGVIVQEINMYEDTPQRRVQELFMECVYGDQPAGWDIAGSKEVVRSLKREDFLKYRGEHYVPQSTVVVVAGGFRESQALSFIRRQFGGFKRTRKSLKQKVKEKQSRPQELVRYKKSDQTHLIMGFRAFPVSDKRRFTLSILTDILGGGMSSRLFHRIREEMGAAYYVNASNDLYSDHGLFTMSAGVDHKKIKSVIRAALEEFGRMKTDSVSSAELRKAKDHVIGTFSLSLETSDELGYFYAMQEVLGRSLQAPEQIVRKIEKVRAEDVRNLSRSLFRDDRLNLSLIGPFRGRSFRKELHV